jgi:hypothetical protein
MDMAMAKSEMEEILKEKLGLPFAKTFVMPEAVKKVKELDAEYSALQSKLAQIEVKV